MNKPARPEPEAPVRAITVLHPNPRYYQLILGCFSANISEAFADGVNKKAGSRDAG
jgi:hypothetical protein